MPHASPRFRHPYFDVPHPCVLGHRGAAGHAPENTIVSFRKALELGADMIESDVHATRDGVPVLMHDPHVERTTEGRGLVSSFLLKDLLALDAGYTFGPEGGDFPFRDQGIRVPTLEQALSEFPDARFNLELKQSSPSLAAEVVRLVASAHERVLLTASEGPAIQAIRTEVARQDVHPALGAGVPDVLAFIESAQQGSEPPPDVMALQIPTEFAGRPLITEPLLAHAHAHGIAVHAWTINDPEEMRELLSLGVDGLVSDFPERARARAHERRGAR